MPAARQTTYTITDSGAAVPLRIVLTVAPRAHESIMAFVERLMALYEWSTGDILTLSCRDGVITHAHIERDVRAPLVEHVSVSPAMRHAVLALVASGYGSVTFRLNQDDVFLHLVTEVTIRIATGDDIEAVIDRAGARPGDQVEVSDRVLRVTRTALPSTCLMRSR